MISNLKKILIILGNVSFFKTLLNFYWSGYLNEVGWISSYQKKRSLDKYNNPLPWVTYSFIEFARDRLTKNMVLLEFGSGNSTLFYSRFVKKVYAIEHDKDWHTELSGQLPENVKLIYKKLDGEEYSNSAKELNETFHIIIIDGRNRVNCIKTSFASLSEDGVIILDDSEREEYKEGIDFLNSRAFKKIDFWGIAPGVFYNKCTTVFYRGNNCLSI